VAEALAERAPVHLVGRASGPVVGELLPEAARARVDHSAPQRADAVDGGVLLAEPDERAEQEAGHERRARLRSVQQQLATARREILVDPGEDGEEARVRREG
jgi:hypothetical protein